MLLCEKCHRLKDSDPDLTPWDEFGVRQQRIKRRERRSKDKKLFRKFRELGLGDEFFRETKLLWRKVAAERPPAEKRSFAYGVFVKQRMKQKLEEVENASMLSGM
jgi:hypothetical protein